MFIPKQNWEKYRGKVVWAMFPETKTKSHARLLDFKDGKFVMKCGVHNNVFECSEIAEIDDFKY